MTEKPLSTHDKIALHLNFEKGVKNCEGYLEITNDVLSFRSIKDGEEAITISVAQIMRAQTETAIFFLGVTWCHYLRIYYKPDNKSAEKHIVFMFKRNAGIYAEDIKSKINDLAQYKEPITKAVKIEKLISKESVVAIIIFILTSPLTFIFGRFLFATFLPTLIMDFVTSKNTIGMVLGIVYLVVVYRLIRFTVRLVIWSVRALKER